MKLSNETTRLIRESDNTALLTYLEYPQDFTPDAVKYAKQEVNRRGGYSRVYSSACSENNNDEYSTDEYDDSMHIFSLTGTPRPQIKRRIDDITHYLEAKLKSVPNTKKVIVKCEHAEATLYPERYSSINHTFVLTTTSKDGMKISLEWNRSEGLFLNLKVVAYNQIDSLLGNGFFMGLAYVLGVMLFVILFNPIIFLMDISPDIKKYLPFILGPIFGYLIVRSILRLFIRKHKLVKSKQFAENMHKHVASWVTDKLTYEMDCPLTYE